MLRLAAASRSGRRSASLARDADSRPDRRRRGRSMRGVEAQSAIRGPALRALLIGKSLSALRGPMATPRSWRAVEARMEAGSHPRRTDAEPTRRASRTAPHGSGQNARVLARADTGIMVLTKIRNCRMSWITRNIVRLPVQAGPESPATERGRRTQPTSRGVRREAARRRTNDFTRRNPLKSPDRKTLVN